MAQQHTLASQQSQIQVQQEIDDITHIERNVHEYAPHLELQDDYIRHVVAELQEARSKYEAASVEQQNTTSQLLTAQAVILEVMGKRHALSKTTAHLNFGKIKDKPCILHKQRYTTEENLHNHIIKEHKEVLGDCVSIIYIVFSI